MKKIIPVVLGAIIIVAVLLMSDAAQDTFKQTGSGDNADAAASPSPIQATGIEGIAPGGNISVKVKRIVDGDTIEVEYKNEDYKVRLLCIDTPETVKRGVDVQPYGKLAAEKLSSMVRNKEVTLVFEKDVDDRYGRLLAYIILKDGTCVNVALVKEGYARVNIVRPNTVHKDFFNELQDSAIKEKKGLWSLPAKKRPFIKNEKGYYVPRYIDEDAA